MGKVYGNIKYRSTCAIAMSIDLFGDKWTLLILRDILIHKKTTVKEFSNSKEKIASNILASRLVNLIETGFIYKLNPKGTKKSAVYLATPKGICTLPLLVELYMFSIGYLEDLALNESQKKIKADIFHDKHLFMLDKRESYLAFVDQIENSMLENQKSKDKSIPKLKLL
ncbi:winged helix-turn-helix transcriptional regulator [Daejeonella sp.]|jgi:DNA-binding HxlR family transcriptional regulator|uniref:winged helix-turn-helix transcriptional regulator n=1 Tax=Daejeonella sp. TaxID=2805397 RepID=UPI003783C5CD